jgi:phosphoribosylaminoimidazole-succinocarboxamide synthase
MFPEGKQYSKQLNNRIMEFTTKELEVLKAVVYKEIMDKERESNVEASVLFRQIYDKLKGLTGTNPYGRL